MNKKAQNAKSDEGTNKTRHVPVTQIQSGQKTQNEKDNDFVKKKKMSQYRDRK